ncbi:MAG: HDIG domain-containing protein [Chlorobi bacterium]|nr:HDIG domain-containing protein [Chlorobiota bacterium]MCI0716510.1 HDIG domain-containing protein [Chlorobiota bacterium]
MEEYNKALELMHEFVRNENLRKHMYSVSEAMRQYAKKYGDDEEKWAVTGLLHDFDWEIHPNAEEHPVKGSEILKQRGYSEEIRRAILSHAGYTGVSRDSLMEKALYACDELSGFIVACALVQPMKKIDDVRVESVRKKMKKKEFARNVNREDIIKGAEELGVELDEHIEFVLSALKGISGKLGL